MGRSLIGRSRCFDFSTRPRDRRNVTLGASSPLCLRVVPACVYAALNRVGSGGTYAEHALRYLRVDGPLGGCWSCCARCERKAAARPPGRRAPLYFRHADDQRRHRRPRPLARHDGFTIQPLRAPLNADVMRPFTGTHDVEGFAARAPIYARSKLTTGYSACIPEGPRIMLTEACYWVRTKTWPPV